MDNNTNEIKEMTNNKEKEFVESPKKEKRKRHIVRNIILLLIVVSLGSTGFFTNETVAVVKKTQYMETTLNEYFNSVYSSSLWSYDNSKEMVYVSGDCIMNDEEVAFKVYFEIDNKDVGFNSFLINDQVQSIEVAKAFFDQTDLVYEGGL